MIAIFIFKKARCSFYDTKRNRRTCFPSKATHNDHSRNKGGISMASGLPLPSDFSFTKALKRANMLRYLELVRDLESIQSGSFPYLSI